MPNCHIFIFLYFYKAGTIAGNLMIKHAHREFPSDIFLTLEALGAKLSIGKFCQLCERNTKKSKY